MAVYNPMGLALIIGANVLVGGSATAAILCERALTYSYDRKRGIETNSRDRGLIFPSMTYLKGLVVEARGSCPGPRPTFRPDALRC